MAAHGHGHGGTNPLSMSREPSSASSAAPAAEEEAAVVAPKPALTKAAARNDLAAVRAIVSAASAAGDDEKANAVNCARIWTERSPAYESEENPAGTTKWFDVTPITVAAMRGHDAVVEYLLASGADPTLKGCPKDDVEPDYDRDAALIDSPELHMNAFEAASKLSRKIRCCRRTQDLLMVVKPYWKRVIYSGSSAARHKRTVFSNEPLNASWVADALGEVPPLKEYPLKARDFDEDMIDSNYWRKRKREEDVASLPVVCSNAPQSVKPFESSVQGQGGRQRRCFSCGELKPEQSYNKNEKRKGVEARCIRCVATNPGTLDLAIVCPICQMPNVDGDNTVCLSCSTYEKNETKPPALKTETE
ncbi:hypothetical protein ACHAWF_014674 [Thalassiosira exigua]